MNKGTAKQTPGSTPPATGGRIGSRARGGRRIGLGGWNLNLGCWVFGCWTVLAAAAFGQERAEHVVASLEGDATVVAEWQAEYRLQVDAGPGGTVAGTPSGWHGAGTTVSNLATPYRRCAFLGWSNVPAGMEGANPLVFALDDAWTNVVANFSIPSEPLQLRPGAGPPPSFEVQAWWPARVQRCDGRLQDDGWRDVGSYGFGATNWTDADPPAAWEQLYYRLAQ